MRILLLSQFFSSTKGGGEYIFKLLAKNLAEHDHKVWIITNKLIDEQYPTHKNMEIIFVPPIIEYKGSVPPTFSENIRYAINAVRAGKKIIKNEKIDLIHSNNFSPALAGSMLSFLTSKPHILAIHDVFSLCGKNYWKLWGKQSNVSRINVFLGPFFEKLMIKLRHNCIHTVSNTTRDDLVKFGAKKPIHVIHNSIDVIQTLDTSEVNPFQFVYVGRLVFYKNLEVVIKAINIAKKIEPKIKLVIVGTGPHKKTLVELCKKLQLGNNVEFKGSVDDKEKFSLISSSNSFVFPSLCEGFGLVILEAFSQNKPVLVSDIKPMSDIVEHEKTGYIINPHDEKQWSNYLLDCIKNEEKINAMGKNGAQTFSSMYTQDSFYQKILKMYNTII